MGIKNYKWADDLHFSFSLLLLFAVVFWPATQVSAQGTALGAWQNPDIGLTYDLKFDWHDAERAGDGSKLWTTRGFNISTAELSVGTEIDPFGRMDFNAMFTSVGAEIHELFFTMPTLPLNLKAKGGKFLASFGRWSQFHSHSMPFSTEPKILGEYLDGHFSGTGIELSWLVPVNHYIELTAGVFNNMQGHTHDSDPTSSNAVWGPDNPPPGCHFHGDEIHCPGNESLEASYWASVVDPEAPVRSRTNKQLQDLAYLGRFDTSFEMGLAWSLDFGATVAHQTGYAHSQRFPGTRYGKTTGGFDVTVFWNPPEKNLYTGLDFGVEYLRNREEFEEPVAENWVKRTLVRDGFFTWLRYRLNRTWQVGTFLENFESRQNSVQVRQRVGGFLTFNISHYQFVRLEYSHYDRSDFFDPVNQFVIQFDGVIGFHTHGRQR